MKQIVFAISSNPQLFIERTKKLGVPHCACMETRFSDDVATDLRGISAISSKHGFAGAFIDKTDVTKDKSEWAETRYLGDVATNLDNISALSPKHAFDASLCDENNADQSKLMLRGKSHSTMKSVLVNFTKHSFQLLCILLLLTLTICIESANGNTITRNAFVGDAICNDFPCDIKCNGEGSCRGNISCPLNGTGICSISLTGTNSGSQSIINGGTSSVINIVAKGSGSLTDSTIYAHTSIGGILSVTIDGTAASARYSTIYTPYGEESEFSLNCITGNSYCCADMNIYDDYSTRVTLKSGTMSNAMRKTEIKNMFNNNDEQSLNVTKNTSLVTIETSSQHGFAYARYEGTNHGNWTIISHGQYGFRSTKIFADHSFVGSESYNILVKGDTISHAIYELTLHASQHNAHILLIGNTSYAMNKFKLLCNENPSLFAIDTLELTQFATTAIDSFHSAEINITNNITNIIIDGSYSSYPNAQFVFETIEKDLTLYATSSASYAFDASVFNLGHIKGNLNVYDNSTGGRAFEDSIINVAYIEGDLNMHDTSNSGYGFQVNRKEKQCKN